MGNVEAAPVLDSDVLIDYLRDAGPGRDLVRRIRATGAYRVTSITAFELALGRAYARNPAPADELLATACLTLSRAAAVRAGSLLRELRAAGSGIDVRDAMQAGICLEAEAPLITRNLRHFARVPGLQVAEPEHWNG
jgi:predicted nucleic acid-binding protein